MLTGETQRGGRERRLKRRNRVEIKRKVERREWKVERKKGNKHDILKCSLGFIQTQNQP